MGVSVIETNRETRTPMVTTTEKAVKNLPMMPFM